MTVEKNDWVVFYTNFNIIQVILATAPIFMCFLGSISTRLGLWGFLPKDTPIKKKNKMCLWNTNAPETAIFREM